MEQDTQLTIVPDLTNPSKADIIDAFSRAFDHNVGLLREPHRLSFKVDDSAGTLGIDTVFLQVTELQYESGTPGVYNIRGAMTWANAQGKLTPPVGAKGCYDANNRAGFFNHFIL